MTPQQILQILCQQLLKNDASINEVIWKYESSDDASATVSLLAESMVKNTIVKEFCLADMKRLGHEALLALAHLLEHNATLENLRINGFIGSESSHIHARGFARFGCALAGYKLRRLVLSGFHNLGDNQVYSLCVGLTLNTRIQHVNLSWNTIGNAGAQGIANVLITNNRIRTLYLQENNISDSGIECICTALRENCTLETINLSRNPLTSKGVIAIGNMLQNNNNTTLKVIRMNGICYKKDGKDALVSAAEQNFVLQEIHVDNDEDLQDQLDFYTALNTKFHRREILLEEDHLPVSLWANILSWYGKSCWKSRHERLRETRFRLELKKLHTKQQELCAQYGMTMLCPSYDTWLDVPLLTTISNRSAGDANVLFYFLKSKPELFQSQQCILQEGMQTRPHKFYSFEGTANTSQ